MKYKRRRIRLLFCLVFFAAGCAQVPKEAGFNEVKGLVEQRVDYSIHWNQETEADREVEKAIDEALRQIIAVGGSLERVALLDNSCFEIENGH